MRRRRGAPSPPSRRGQRALYLRLRVRDLSLLGQETGPHAQNTDLHREDTQGSSEGKRGDAPDGTGVESSEDHGAGSSRRGQCRHGYGLRLGVGLYEGARILPSVVSIKD